MSKKLMRLALALMLTAAPLSAIAGMGAEENINIYGWQNWSYEWIDADEGREYDRMSGNAANIGFMAHMDTGIDGLQVGLRCEQFTLWDRHNVRSNWCNRNSKISLRHETMGEIMFGQWLLPYNEIVAQWVDPFYDAGKDSHTSIMGNIGDTASNQDITSMYYNGSFDSEFGDSFGALSFNRRQEGIVQYVWPNTGAMGSQTREGFQFRFAITDGDAGAAGVDNVAPGGAVKLDPRIWSTGVAYQKNVGDGRIWVAAAYEQHDDLSASALSEESLCRDSEDTAYHIAGRYSHDWGGGQSSWLAVMYEELEYDADDCAVIPAQAAVPLLDALSQPGSLDPPTSITIPISGTATPIWSGVERDAWMISGKHAFGNGFDVRFSYMDADDWDCDGNVKAANACDSTGADAYNIGLFYTMPAGTELRATYTDLSNDTGAQYDFLFNTDAQTGEDIEMIAVGIVHWFD